LKPQSAARQRLGVRRPSAAFLRRQIEMVPMLNQIAMVADIPALPKQIIKIPAQFNAG
jgi:hypothetical protein